MKVLLVNGSPRQHGCTDAALSEVAAQLTKNGVEAEIFWLGNRAINGCLGCGYAYAEEREDVSFEMRWVAVGVEHGKVYIYCVEHKLGADEQRHKVATGEKPEYSYKKEYRR